eukprot:9485380-Pyramimonas_sp.AAC.1
MHAKSANRDGGRSLSKHGLSLATSLFACPECNVAQTGLSLDVSVDLAVMLMTTTMTTTTMTS